jgi:hypothetical protein
MKRATPPTSDCRKVSVPAARRISEIEKIVFDEDAGTVCPGHEIAVVQAQRPSAFSDTKERLLFKGRKREVGTFFESGLDEPGVSGEIASQSFEGFEETHV